MENETLREKLRISTQSEQETRDRWVVKRTMWEEKARELYGAMLRESITDLRPIPRTGLRPNP